MINTQMPSPIIIVFALLLLTGAVVAPVVVPIIVLVVSPVIAPVVPAGLTFPLELDSKINNF
jgi:hypothetical protein